MKIHISPNGSDRGDGSLKRPFATPRHAQRQARKSKKQIIVGDGIYELESTLVFTPADSGQRWSAAAGAKPVFSGGRTLTGWVVTTHEGVPAWIMDLPDVRKGDWYFTQLWVNGQRRERPRHPREGFFRFTGVDGAPDTGFMWGTGPDRAEYPEGSIKNFKNLGDVSLITYQLWFDTHHRIKSLNEKRLLAHFHTNSLGSLRDESGDFARFFLKNVGEELAEPGEWYLDRAAGRLTYLPLPGETPESVTVVAPRLQELVRIEGSRTKAAADIIFENLGFEHNEWSRPKENSGTMQAAFDVPGAIILERAERCVFYGCEIAHIAGYGVEMLAGSHGNIVASSTIHDLGGGAVKIGHESLVVHEDTIGVNFTPPEYWHRPMAATVADCHLHDGGHVYPSSVGVFIGNSGQNRIQHNEIRHFAYTGISLGWSWFWEKTRTSDNRIESNHIHHINYNRVLSDNGGIYTLGVQAGTTLIGNHIHDIACYHYGGWGIYPDQGSSNMLIQDNLVHHVQYAGFAVHAARFLTVRNNIFAVMEKDMLAPGRTDMGRGQVFERNLTWFDRDNLKPDVNWAPSLVRTKNNLIWNAGTGGVRWHQGSLEKENAMGRWLDSLEADPLFADPRGADFSLREDSPAFGLGFRPFDWRKAGVRHGARRPLAWTDYHLPAAPQKSLALAYIKTESVKTVGDIIEASLEVSLWNPSPGRVRGRWTLRADDGSKVTVKPGPKLEADLAPGASVVRKVQVRLLSGSGRRWLIAAGDERVSFSAAQVVILPEVVSIPRLPPGSSAELSTGLDLDINSTGTPILTGRAAIIGDSIALDFTVRDETSRVNPRAPWLGASLEIFAAPEPDPNPKSTFTEYPSQLVIYPPGEHGPAEVRSCTGRELPSRDWDITAVEGGWRARVQIPFTAFNISPTAKSFRMDYICNCNSPVPGQNHIRLTRWGDLSSCFDLNSLARVVIT